MRETETRMNCSQLEIRHAVATRWRVGCSSSVEALARRAMHYVGFQRLIYPAIYGRLLDPDMVDIRSSPRSHFNRRTTDNSRIPALVWGAKRVSPRRLFCHISSSLVWPPPPMLSRAFPRASTNINNCPRNFSSRPDCCWNPWTAISHDSHESRELFDLPTYVSGWQAAIPWYFLCHARRYCTDILCPAGCWPNDGARRMINAQSAYYGLHWRELIPLVYHAGIHDQTLLSQASIFCVHRAAFIAAADRVRDHTTRILEELNFLPVFILDRIKGTDRRDSPSSVKWSSSELISNSWDTFT